MEVNQYTKLFELLDITDFSLENANENSKKFELLAERLYSENNSQWERAWKLHQLFSAAYSHYNKEN